MAKMTKEKLKKKTELKTETIRRRIVRSNKTIGLVPDDNNWYDEGEFFCTCNECSWCDVCINEEQIMDHLWRSIHSVEGERTKPSGLSLLYTEI